MFKPNSIIIYVKNVDISTDFYTKLFAQEPIETYPGFAVFLLKDEFVLGLQQADEITPKAPKHYGGFELSLSDVTKDEIGRAHV